MSVRRPWAWPLVPVYRAALAVEDALRATSFARPRRLEWPVLSVGSLSAGGAGKTPVCLALAKLLTERGWKVNVLSRGYGRSGSGVERVDAGLEDAAHRFGDEPVLLAERSGVPVWVGADRFAAGRLAEASAAVKGRTQGATDALEQNGDAGGPVRAHILDDGFQHRSLERQFELVLVTEADLRDTVLPAGNLREPLAALRRADALAVREEELDEVSERLRAIGAPDVPLWTVRRALRFPPPLGVFGAGLRPLAFCALARPENFAAMLTGAGCGLVDTVLFDDHHRYAERDLMSLIRVAKGMTATGLVTTEKDAVKLSGAMRARLEAEVGPLMVVRLETSFVFESPVVRALEKRLRALRTEPKEAEAHVR